MILKYIKELSRNSIYYGLGSAVRRFFAIFTAPIMTRIFEPSDYGVISLVSTTIAFAGMIITLGISAGIFRYYFEVNEKERKELLFSGIISQTLIIGSIVFIISVFSGSISNIIFKTDKYAFILILALIQLFIVELFEHFMTLLRYQNKPKQFLIVSSIQLSLNLFFLLFYVAYLRLGIPGVYYGMITAYTIPLIILLFNLKKYYSLKLNLGYVKNCIVFSLPLMPGWFVNMYMARSNVFYLQAYNSIEEVGLYSIGERIAGFAAMIMTIFFLAWDPVSMKLINKKSQHYLYDSISRIFLFISSIGIIFITLFSKEMLIIFATEKYYPAYQYAGLIAFGTMTFYLNYFFGQGIIISKKTIYQSIARICGAVVATMIFVILIPRYGGLGAAYGLVAGYASASILLIIISNKLYYLPYKINRLISAYIIIFSIIIFYNAISTDVYVLSIATIIIKSLSVLIASVILIIITFKINEIKNIYSMVQSKIK